MEYALPIAANLILGSGATMLGASGIGKWPRLFLWVGGFGFGTATMCAVLSMIR